MISDEKVCIETFKKQYADLEKNRNVEIRSIFFEDQDKLTANSIFKLYILFVNFSQIIHILDWNS